MVSVQPGSAANRPGLADFYSDVKSRPTAAMRATVLEAEVGDEQAGEDPTTLALCCRVADLLGKEAALFMASGSLCNEVAINLHCRPGQEIVCDRTAHIINFEGGGPAAISGAQVHPIDGDRGRFTAEQAAAAINPKDDAHMPETALISVEQTANLGGGAIWERGDLEAVAALAREAGIASHMDGARLLNACVKTGIAAWDFAAGYDTVWIDFTKGLGCPVGAVLAGSEDLMRRARRVRQRLGGGLRQAGFVAAACLYALDHHVDRLAEDHALAAGIGKTLAGLPGVARLLPVETNIVIFETAPAAPTADELVAALAAEDIRIGQFGDRRLRIVTHLDVGEAEGARLMAALEKHLS